MSYLGEGSLEVSVVVCLHCKTKQVGLAPLAPRIAALQSCFRGQSLLEAPIDGTAGCDNACWSRKASLM